MKKFLVPTFAVVAASSQEEADAKVSNLQSLARQHDVALLQDELLPTKEIGTATSDEEVHTILDIFEPSVFHVPRQRFASAEDAGRMLRVQALALMQEAERVDGMKMYQITHNHRHGHDDFFVWSKNFPEPKKVIGQDTLEIGDSIEANPFRPLEQILGVDPISRMDDLLMMADSGLDCFVEVSGEASDADDEGVQGFYQVAVKLTRPVNVDALSDSDGAEIAKAVLDTFHESQGISVLDDFLISVYLSNGLQVTEEEEDVDGCLVSSANYIDKLDEDALPFEVAAQTDAIAPKER